MCNCIQNLHETAVLCSVERPARHAALLCERHGDSSSASVDFVQCVLYMQAGERIHANRIHARWDGKNADRHEQYKTGLSAVIYVRTPA